MTQALDRHSRSWDAASSLDNFLGLEFPGISWNFLGFEQVLGRVAPEVLHRDFQGFASKPGISSNSLRKIDCKKIGQGPCFDCSISWLYSQSPCPPRAQLPARLTGHRPSVDPGMLHPGILDNFLGFPRISWDFLGQALPLTDSLQFFPVSLEFPWIPLEKCKKIGQGPCFDCSFYFLTLLSNTTVAQNNFCIKNIEKKLPEGWGCNPNLDPP